MEGKERLVHPPELVGEPGWRRADPLRVIQDLGPSFVSGDPGSSSLRVRYFVGPEEHVLWGKVWVGPGCQGPPLHAHGGAMAALMDEAIGAVAWQFGHPIVVAEFTTRFRRLVPLGALLTLRARLERVAGRRVHTSAAVMDGEGQILTEATGICIKIPVERIEELRSRQELSAEEWEEIMSRVEGRRAGMDQHRRREECV